MCPTAPASSATLAPGASSVASCQHTTTANDVPQMTNQVLATANRGVFGLSGTRRTRVLANTFQPDGRIRLGGGLAVGDNIYNITGANQRRSASVPNRGTATFTAVIQNDGNTTGNFRLRGRRARRAGAPVTYRRRRPRSSPPQVLNGTYAIDGLAPGATRGITITIRAKAGTPRGSTISRLLTVTSVNGGIKDAVKSHRPPSAERREG